MRDYWEWARVHAKGKPEPLPKKFTQLVKNHHEANFKLVNPLPCITMEKMDGLCGLLVRYNGNTALFSRTGLMFKNTEHLVHMVNLNLPTGSYDNFVVCVELCNDELELEEIGSVFNPNRVNPVDWTAKSMNAFYLSCYDLLTFDEFVNGRSTLQYKDRLKSLVKSQFSKFMYVPRHNVCYSESDVKTLADSVINNGGEGVVRCIPEAPWVAGHKGIYKTKIVCGVDYDLEVIDIELGKAGTKRDGVMTNVVVRWRNWKTGELTTMSIDGCFTDQQRIEFANDESLIIGKIVHIHALKLGSKGALRIPKVKAIRIDKEEADL